MDATRGGEESVGRGDDCVPSPDPHGHENGKQRVCAGRGADGITAAGVIAHSGFEFFDRRAEDELLAVAQRVHATLHIVFHLRILQAQIEQRDCHEEEVC